MILGLYHISLRVLVIFFPWRRYRLESNDPKETFKNPSYYQEHFEIERNKTRYVLCCALVFNCRKYQRGKVARCKTSDMGKHIVSWVTETSNMITAAAAGRIYSPPKQRRGMAERKENSAHVEIIDERGRKSFQCKICRRRLWSCRYVHFFPFVLIYLFSKGYFSWYWFIWILLFSIGRTHPFPDGHPDADFLKQNFGLVNLDVIRQVARVVKCGQRYFSFIYKRMKRRMCFTVLLKDRIVGAIQYFVLNQSTRNVHAVITRYNIGVPSFLDTIAGGNHLTSVKVDENPT